MFAILVILLLLFGIPVLLLIYVYNKLVGLRNRVEETFSQIDVLLTRRADLIPNLVATVKGYAGHEKSVLENVTQSRGALLNASAPAEKFGANEGLSGALKSLFAVVENYPNLKADQNFRELQAQLAGIEEDIARARSIYNQSVRDYNTQQQTFPANLFASTFGHNPRQYYEVVQEKKEPPKVSF